MENLKGCASPISPSRHHPSLGDSAGLKASLAAYNMQSMHPLPSLLFFFFNVHNAQNTTQPQLPPANLHLPYQHTPI